MMPIGLTTVPASLSTHALLAVACVLATFGVYYLMPQPRGRALLYGSLLCIAAAVIFGMFLVDGFGMAPTADDIGSFLFWKFSFGALLFGTILVTQSNPARGAIAFAFVILSTCGLFLLLAAPFLMAATVIIYAGAIIVTFLFVLMLSHAGGPSDENDRTRDPLIGSLAGFAFAGLVLFTLYSATQTKTALPVEPLTTTEKATLVEVGKQLREAGAAGTPAEFLAATKGVRDKIGTLVGTGDPAADGTAALPTRLQPVAADPRTAMAIGQVNDLRAKTKAGFDGIENKLLGSKPDLDGAKKVAAELGEKVAILAGRGEIPARNVGTIGLSLYSEHLIAVELAGTLLLVATIGAVAIAQRKGAVA